MKSVFKKLKVMFLIFAMLISNSSAIILASNSGDVSISENIEVTNNLDDNLSDANGGGDTLFGAVPTYSVGDTLYFGRYPQNTKYANVLEPIKWRVLSISTDNSKALLISDKTLDFKHYHNTAGSITWEACDLRRWLNNSFYNTAFTTTEKSAIKKETLTTDGSSDTEDNVFLLSGGEATSLFSSDNDRICYTTFYTRNVELDGHKLMLAANYSSCYWLRGERFGDNNAATVSNIGTAPASELVEDPEGYCAVRPAIYIDLTSSYFSAEESSITYNLDGGDWIKDNTPWKEFNKYREGEVNALPTANEVKKDGYIFKGWSINGSENLEISITTGFTGNLTIKAIWAEEGSRDLTDREKAAYIVRNEWTNWVNSFTNELKELDKNATSRIYSNMDFYDMQYRFTEKYKKVPEYLDEDGKPTEKLKKLISEKRKELAGGAKKIKDYLKFTSNQNGSTVEYYAIVSTNNTLNYDMGYSKDGITFTKWNPNETITLDAGEYIYVQNKTETLSKSTDNRLRFRMSGSIAASGNVMSLLNFSEEVPSYAFNELFSGCSALTTAPELPSTLISMNAYRNMFSGCTNLKEAPDLPAINLPEYAYYNMFRNCTNLEKGPYIKAKTITTIRVPMTRMFDGCTNLKYIKLDYTDPIYFDNWVNGVTATGKLYYNYNGSETIGHNSNQIPTNFTVEPFTD